VQGGDGVVRIPLREGQARRLRSNELPDFDRPLRYAIARTRQDPALGDTIADALAALKRDGEGEGRGDSSKRRGVHASRHPGGTPRPRSAGLDR
jgi:hypothetical protein